MSSMARVRFIAVLLLWGLGEALKRHRLLPAFEQIDQKWSIVKIFLLIDM